MMIGARGLSMVFTPFYLPLVGLLALFTLSYLSLLPFSYKCMVMAIVYLFTILMPTLLIYLFRRLMGWSLHDLGRREHRLIPYAISIVCYYICVRVMGNMHFPHFMGSIVMVALIIQMLCAVINIWWKISTHTTAIGGVAGALFAFANIFSFNPLFWVCLVTLLAGVLGTSRMILRMHSLSQVVVGYLLGCVAGTLILVV